MNVSTAEQLFTATTQYIALNHDTVEDAKKRFQEFKDSGIIKARSDFEDNVWYTTDQYSNVGLHFEFDEVSYRRHYKDLLGIQFGEFMDLVKTYLISLFGKNVLLSISNVLLDIRHIINTNPKHIYTTGINLDMPWLCQDFFTMLAENMENPSLEVLSKIMGHFWKEKL